MRWVSALHRTAHLDIFSHTNDNLQLECMERLRCFRRIQTIDKFNAPSVRLGPINDGRRELRAKPKRNITTATLHTKYKVDDGVLQDVFLILTTT
jgi:hypothetical protein